MTDKERFLSVILRPHHLPVGRIRHTAEKDGAMTDLPRPMALTLEYMDGQWVMYYLNNDEKIQTCWFAESLDDAYARARHEFEIKSDEWIEDFSN